MVRERLTVSDGLHFGCGLMLSVIAAVILLIGSLVAFPAITTAIVEATKK